MMKLASFLVVLAFVQVTLGDADTCEASKCDIKKNCRCSSTNGPLSLEETPQFIVLAFVDAAKEDIYKNRWAPLVESRKNPDGQFVSATFYVPHEYSDYQIVHDLAVNGFEVGVHSVTNDPHQSYWKNADQQLLEKEFGSQRKIISKFANIPIENIKGTLTPQLELAGDNSINAFVAQKFTYDSSWSSKTHLFPYTLDYASTQNCEANCPKDSHPGFWIAPIVNLVGDDGDVCATLAGCFRKRNNQTADEISDWLVNQVNQIKKTNRAPITLIVEDNLFTSVNNSWDGLVKALDTIQQDQETFLVSEETVIEWLNSPVAVSKFQTQPTTIDTGCSKNTCNLQKPDGQKRYMVSCVPCPKNYPWLDNPEGN